MWHSAAVRRVPLEALRRNRNGCPDPESLYTTNMAISICEFLHRSYACVCVWVGGEWVLWVHGGIYHVVNGFGCACIFDFHGQAGRQHIEDRTQTADNGSVEFSRFQIRIHGVRVVRQSGRDSNTEPERERESRQGRHTYTHRKWFHWHVVELLLIVLLSCCRYGCCCVGNRVRQSSRVSNNNKPSIRLPNYKIEGKHTEVKAKESGSSIGNMKKETGQRRKNLINQC